MNIAFPRRLRPLFLCTAFWGATSGAAHAQPAPTTPASPAKKRVEVFEQVWTLVDQKYYDSHFRGVNWKAMRAKYLPRAEKAASEAAFYHVLQQMVDELHDAHTRVLSPQEHRREVVALQTEKPSEQDVTCGVEISEVEGASLVSKVAPNSEAARAGVAPGMRVRTVDGKPIAQALREQRLAIGTTSTERLRDLRAYEWLTQVEPGQLLRLGLTRADGSALDVALSHHVVDAPATFDAHLLPSGTAYIRFSNFVSPADEQVKAALEKFRDAPDLIIDLRDNTGGQLGVELDITGYFFNDEVSAGKRVTRTGEPISLLFGLIKIPNEETAGDEGEQLFAHPVAVLINGWSASASESFASTMQDHGRARIIGTNSCGALVEAISRTLQDGGELTLSEFGFVTSKGRTVEGVGVLPDIRVPVTRLALQTRRDGALEAAEAYFARLRKIQTTSLNGAKKPVTPKKNSISSAKTAVGY